jgi:hypothetical protein
MSDHQGKLLEAVERLSLAYAAVMDCVRSEDWDIAEVAATAAAVEAAAFRLKCQAQIMTRARLG